MTTRTTDHAAGADIWTRVLSREGAVALIACVLVVWLTRSVDGAFQDLNTEMDAMRGEHSRLLQAQREQAYYLKAICFAVADDETERALCIYQEPR